MKFLTTVMIAHLTVIWALPSQLHNRVYVPCSNNLYDTAYCCSEGPLGDYLEYVFPLQSYLRQGLDFLPCHVHLLVFEQPFYAQTELNLIIWAAARTVRESSFLIFTTRNSVTYLYSRHVYK